MIQPSRVVSAIGMTTLVLMVSLMVLVSMPVDASLPSNVATEKEWWHTPLQWFTDELNTIASSSGYIPTPPPPPASRAANGTMPFGFLPQIQVISQHWSQSE
jgi:hypothetical protein